MKLRANVVNLQIKKLGQQVWYSRGEDGTREVAEREFIDGIASYSGTDDKTQIQRSCILILSAYKTFPGSLGYARVFEKSSVKIWQFLERKNID